MSYVLKVSLDNPEHSLTKKRIDYREQANKLCSFVEKIGGEIKETGTDSFEFLITMPAVLGEPEDIVQKIIQKMNTNIG